MAQRFPLIGDIEVGDEVSLLPHEICPVDGEVVQGHGAMDESYLTGEPYVLSKVPGAANRAIAGFSLGGRQTLAAGLSNPKTFAYVCAFAPAVWKREFDESFKTIYAATSELNANLKLLWVSVGKADFLYQPTVDLVAAFDEKKIHYTSHYSEGGHTWMNVRDYVEKTIPLLFKQ
jgi:enterochelin esterase-like enzyme